MFAQTSDTHIPMACANLSSIFDLVKVYSAYILQEYVNMSDTDDTCAAAIVTACLTEKKKVKRKRKQRVWMKE